MALQCCLGTSPSASKHRKGREILRKDADPDLPWLPASPEATGDGHGAASSELTDGWVSASLGSWAPGALCEGTLGSLTGIYPTGTASPGLYGRTAAPGLTPAPASSVSHDFPLSRCLNNPGVRVAPAALSPLPGLWCNWCVAQGVGQPPKSHFFESYCTFGDYNIIAFKAGGTFSTSRSAELVKQVCIAQGAGPDFISQIPRSEPQSDGYMANHWCFS